MLLQNTVVVQGNGYTSSKMALRMKRQTNWLPIFLNYFAVILISHKYIVWDGEWVTKKEEHLQQACHNSIAMGGSTRGHLHQS